MVELKKMLEELRNFHTESELRFSNLQPHFDKLIKKFISEQKKINLDKKNLFW